MILHRRIILIMLSVFILNSCQMNTKKPSETGLINYGKQAQWIDKLKQLAKGKQTKLRILQIGDSHTAGDFFTGELRYQLQKKWGNGGIGWIYPHQVAGQRSNVVEYKGNWKTLSSRKDQSDFPFGGVLARSNGAQAVSISAKTANNEVQQISLFTRPVLANQTLVIKTPLGNVQTISPSEASWKVVSLVAPLPLSYQSQGNDIWEVGAINIENKHSGVIVSALGINGAQLSQWSKWQPNWEADLKMMQADLIILAYGTNEAFNSNLNIEKTAQKWRETIQRIKRALPHAAILIIAAPESLSNLAGKCGTRPAMLDSVQRMQQEVAKAENIFYWSWQSAMGGKCSMKHWMEMKLARQDGIHFSAQGYQKVANQFIADIFSLMEEQ